MAGKTDKPKKPEPAPVTEARTFREALEEMGFVPLNVPRRIIRLGRARNPLTHWRKR